MQSSWTTTVGGSVELYSPAASWRLHFLFMAEASVESRGAFCVVNLTFGLIRLCRALWVLRGRGGGSSAMFVLLTSSCCGWVATRKRAKGTDGKVCFIWSSVAAQKLLVLMLLLVEDGVASLLFSHTHTEGVCGRRGYLLGTLVWNVQL